MRKVSGRIGDVATNIRFHKGKQVTDDYTLQTEDVLGTGYSGPVYSALAKESGKKYAIKDILLGGISPGKLQELETECEVFLCVDHPHVARLVDVYRMRNKLSLVMECLDGGELFDRVLERKAYLEADTADTAYQMLLALNYLHEHHIVHRDVKLENFLYESPTSDHLKLIDFGFSKILVSGISGIMSKRCGTLEYMAPEVLDQSYTMQCDMWSLGVTTFILLSGYMPFAGERSSLMQNIRQRNIFVKDAWREVSRQADDFVLSLLEVDPAKRLTSAQALQHSFITERSKRWKHTGELAVDQSTSAALYGFAAASKIRRAALTAMAWSLTADDRKDLREEFMAMDKDNSGTISLSEFTEVVRNQYEISGEDIERAFEQIDAAGDHEIHYTEFLAAMVSKRVNLYEDLLRSTFRRFDKDDSGYLEPKELQEVLGEEFDGSDIEELMDDADDNHDGKISWAEFLHFAKEGDTAQHDHAMELIESELSRRQREVEASAHGCAMKRRSAIYGMIIDNEISKRYEASKPVLRRRGSM